MDNLLEQAYNCYLVYLDRLMYGKVNQNYCLLYDSILAIANNIDDEQYVQYFEANLLCPINYPLNITDDMNRIISWTLNASETVENDFVWTDFSAPTNKTYSFSTNQVSGFNFLYVSIPQNENFYIYNELDMTLYDSTLPAGNPAQLFSLAGTTTTSNGQTNNIYRKNDVFNSTNSVLFKIKLY